MQVLFSPIPALMKRWVEHAQSQNGKLSIEWIIVVIRIENLAKNMTYQGLAVASSESSCDQPVYCPYRYSDVAPTQIWRDRQAAPEITPMETKALFFVHSIRCGSVKESIGINRPARRGFPSTSSGTTLMLLPVLSDRIDESGTSKFVASGCPLFPIEWEPGADVQILD